MPDAVSLTLKPERLIRGRIINTEGRPVVGAAVAVLTTMASSSGSLDEFLTAWGRDWNLAPLKTDRRLHANLSPLVGTNSDADGRFEIHGIGAEQVAILQLAAPDIATTIL